MTRKATTAEQAKQQSAALKRVTGQWYCSSSNHYTAAPASTWRGRRICEPCKTELLARRKKEASHV